MSTAQLLQDVTTASATMTAEQANEWLVDHATTAMMRLTANGEKLTETSVAAEMEQGERRLHAAAMGQQVAGLTQELARHMLVMVSAAKLVMATR